MPRLIEWALSGASGQGVNKFAPSFVPKKQKEDLVSSPDSQAMKPLPFNHSIFCLLLVFAGGASAQEASPKLIQNPRILYSSTVRNASMSDGTAL